MPREIDKKARRIRNFAIYLAWKLTSIKQSAIAIHYEISPSRVHQIIRDMCRRLGTCFYCKSKEHRSIDCNEKETQNNRMDNNS